MSRWADGNRRSPEQEISLRYIQAQIDKATEIYKIEELQKLRAINWWLKLQQSERRCLTKANGSC